MLKKLLDLPVLRHIVVLHCQGPCSLQSFPSILSILQTFAYGLHIENVPNGSKTCTKHPLEFK